MEESKRGKEEYKKLVDMISPNSNISLNCTRAFFVGGSICLMVELYKKWLETFDFAKDDVSLIINITVIGITALLTGMGIFNKIGKFAGAGTFVPITGFANAMVSPALEFKKEGWIFGMAAKMFIVAGPVIVYGILTSYVVGIVYYILEKVVG